MNDAGEETPAPGRAARAFRRPLSTHGTAHHGFGHRLRALHSALARLWQCSAPLKQLFRADADPPRPLARWCAPGVRPFSRAPTARPGPRLPRHAGTRPRPPRATPATQAQAATALPCLQRCASGPACARRRRGSRLRKAGSRAPPARGARAHAHTPGPSHPIARARSTRAPRLPALHAPGAANTARGARGHGVLQRRSAGRQAWRGVRPGPREGAACGRRTGRAATRHPSLCPFPLRRAYLGEGVVALRGALIARRRKRIGVAKGVVAGETRGGGRDASGRGACGAAAHALR